MGSEQEKRPGRTFTFLLNDDRRVGHAVFAVLVPAVGYTLMFLCWVLASGVVQLLSRLFSGGGSFEDTAAAGGLTGRNSSL
jgi:hypothetical protein